MNNYEPVSPEAIDSQGVFQIKEIEAIVETQKQLLNYPEDTIIAFAQSIQLRRDMEQKLARKERERMEAEAKERARIAEDAAADSELFTAFKELEENDDLESEFFTAALYEWDSYDEDYVFEGIGLVNNEQLGINNWVNQHLPAGLVVKVTIELIEPTNGSTRKQLQRVLQ